MIRVYEEVVDIDGRKQYKILLETESFDEVRKEFLKYSGENKAILFVDGEYIREKFESLMNDIYQKHK